MTTVAEIRGAGPIFCTTAAVATDRTQYNYSSASPNHEIDASAYYMEQEYPWDSGSGPSSSVGWLLAAGGNCRLFYNSGSSAQVNTYDGGSISNRSYSYVADELLKLGLVYLISDDSKQLNVDGVYGSVGTCQGYTPVGPVAFQTTNLAFPMKYREIQRFDITSFQNGKDIIDGLMAEVLVAEDDSELTTETNDSLTKG